MRRTCVVTGSRADYGLLRQLLRGIDASEWLQLQLVVTGAHLAPEFGCTGREIEADGFRVCRRVEMILSSDTARGVTKSMGLGLIGFADVLDDLQPDVLLVLGDRYEMLAAAVAATFAGVPIAHIHGGEITRGAVDEAIRHAITKMSQLHFVAAEDYRRRVIQLGEDPDRVFLVGGLGVDSILSMDLLDRSSLEQVLGLRLGQRSLLVTFHPETTDVDTEAHLVELLAALGYLTGTSIIFTMPNADVGGRSFHERMKTFADRYPNARVYESLGQRAYLSCIAQVDGVVGNSSSGILEAPSLGTPTINIGDRQQGRLRADSVIDCAPERAEILAAVSQLYSPEMQARLHDVKNPYGTGGASARVVEHLERLELRGLLKKSFHDIDDLFGGGRAG